MKKTQNRQKGKAHPVNWASIGQYSLSKGFFEGDIHDKFPEGPFYQTMLRLGVSSERIRKITWSVKETVGERHALPVQVRLFCQWKIVEKILQDTLPKESNIPITTDSFQDFLDLNITLESPEEKKSGGWGYFLIERGENLFSPHQASPCLIELYLYRDIG